MTARIIMLLIAFVLPSVLYAQKQIASSQPIAQADSAKGHFDSLTTRGLDTLSSLNDRAIKIVDRLNSTDNTVRNSMDTLKSGNALIDSKKFSDSPGSKLNSGLDTLKSLSFPEAKLNQRIAETNHALVDSLNQLHTAAGTQLTHNGVSSLKDSVNRMILPVEGSVNEKLTLFSENGGDLPGAINLPEANLETSLNSNIHFGTDVIDVQSLENPLNKIEMPDNGLDKITLSSPKLPDVNVTEINGQQQIDALDNNLQKLNKGTEEIKAYQDDANNLKQGDVAHMEKIPGAVESKVENLAELDGAKEAIKDFEKVKQNWSDPEVAKEAMLNKAKESAINHFAGHEEELKAMMTKVSEVKSKVPAPEGAVDILAKRQQFYKDKPLIERFLPGICFQFQKQQSFWLDVNAYAGFKITGRFIGGLGWNERIAYDFDNWNWDRRQRIYGARAFMNFKLKDILSLKAEAELMNSPLKLLGFNTASEVTGRKWVPTYFGGVKKEFRFTKSLKGTVQMLYNIYDPNRQSPYANRLNIRMGFEFPIFKKKKTSMIETQDSGVE